jgi:hypothetical protein
MHFQHTTVHGRSIFEIFQIERQVYMENEGNSNRNRPTKAQLARVQLDDGTIFFVKVLPLTSESEVSLHAASFETAMDAIEGIGKRLSKAWETLKPGKATVEMSIDFTTEAGKLLAIVVEGSATASMKITLEWNGDSATK